MRQIYLIPVFVFCAGVENPAQSQCTTIKLSDEEKAAKSDFVFEGRVIGKYSFYDSNRNIQTSNGVEVYRNIGKKTLPAYIEVITPGGIIEDEAQLYFPGLNLQTGERGIFYCTEKEGKYYPFGLAQGFVPIDNFETKASDGEVYNISPLNNTAGTQDEITITGFGFGYTQGSGTVSFRNADNGGTGWVSIPPGPHYISWSNTTIKMLIPTYTQNGIAVSGSGDVKITTAESGTITSTQQINIHYAHNELVYNNQIGKVTLADRNGEGGYTMKLSSLIAQNEGVLQSLKKAVSTWRCGTGVNVDLDVVDVMTTPPNFNDGISSISFDELGMLPAGALATTIIYVTACHNEGITNWQLREADIIFSTSANWYTGTDNPNSIQYDFESVALHEFGHFHLQQHNNNPNSVMYYNLTTGQVKRSLLYDSALDGGIALMQKSINAGYLCNSNPHITPLGIDNCSIVGVDESAVSANEIFSVYPNPSNGNLTLIFNNSTENKRINIYNTVGELVWSQETGRQNIFNFTLPFSQGVYLLELQTEKNSHTRKLILQ